MKLVESILTRNPLLHGGKEDHGQGADAPFRWLPAAESVRLHQFVEQPSA